MHVSIELRYPAPVGRVGAMLADEEFWRLRAHTTGGVAENVDITGSPAGGFAVAQRRTLASELIPAHLRTIVGDQLEVRQAQAWEPERDGERRGTVALEIVGAPVRLSGTMRLTPDGEGCVHRYDGEITATIPLFAAALEEAAAEAAASVLRAEEEAGRRWLNATS